MERKYYNIILTSVIAVVCVFFIAFHFFNSSVDRELEVQMYKTAKESILQELKLTRQEEFVAEKEITKAHKLTPYTIKVQKQSILLGNQHYWDSNTKMILKGTDVMERMDEANVFAGNKKTPEQFKRQLQRIDGRIREYQMKVQNNPADDHARQKLQNLYMLRATVSGLEKVVVKK